MRGRDLDREQSEEKHSLQKFLKIYNAGLPTGFPRASASLLNAFQNAHPTQFKEAGVWSLDLHRKKVMDWLPAHLKSLQS